MHLAELERIRLMDAASAALFAVSFDGDEQAPAVTVALPPFSGGRASPEAVASSDTFSPARFALPPPTGGSAPRSVTITAPAVRGFAPPAMHVALAEGSSNGDAPTEGTIVITTDTDVLTETYSYSFGDDGAFTMNVTFDDVYELGEGNSGSDTITFNIVMGPDSTTVAITQISYYTFNLGGALSGPDHEGTWSASGNGSFHYQSTTTIGLEGVVSESFSIDSEYHATYDVTVSGVVGGNSYTLKEGGDHLTYHEDQDSEDGSRNVTDSQKSTGHVDLSETMFDGATVTAKIEETATYLHTVTPAEDESGQIVDTVTTTSVGREDYTYEVGSKSFGDGGVGAANGSHGGTWNETATVEKKGGPATPPGSTWNKTATTYTDLDETVSGVRDGSVTSSIHQITHSESTRSDVGGKSTGPDGPKENQTVRTTTSGTSSASGSGPWGPFSESGWYATDLTMISEDGQFRIVNDSPPPTPPTSTGTRPTGSITNDLGILANAAFLTPTSALAAADDDAARNSGLDLPGPPATPPYMMYAVVQTTSETYAAQQDPDPGVEVPALPRPRQPAQPAAFPVEVTIDPQSLKGMTDDELVALSERQMRLAEFEFRAAENFGARAEKVADLKVTVEINTIFVNLKGRSTGLETLRKWMGLGVRNRQVTLSEYLNLLANQSILLAHQYEANVIAINAEIARRSHVDPE